jgi:hypothetical protein
MNYLQIINKVLRKLRQNQTQSIDSSEYVMQIADFVNDAKRMVEDAYWWTQLREQKQLTVTPSSNMYMLELNDRGRIWKEWNGREYRPVFQCWESGNWLKELTTTFTSWNLDRDTGSQEPNVYSMNGKTCTLYPFPNKTYNYRYDVLNPQDDLLIAEDNLLVPSQPVILRAYAMAISERGEDGGASYNEADDAARRSLADSVGIQAQAREQDFIMRVS